MNKTIKLNETKLKEVLHCIIVEKKVEKDVTRLFESSWSRILQWIDSYDIAIITAFRGELKNVHNEQRTEIPEGMKVGDSFSLKQNREKNRRLKAFLLSKGYGVTEIHGSWIEGIGGSDAVEKAEESFFVVNLNNSPSFKDVLFNLSEYYNQDSFIYKPKGVHAYVIGTNDNDYPGYGNFDDIGELTSLPSKLMSRIKNASFAFVNKDKWIIKDKKCDLSKEEMEDYEHSYSWKKDEAPTYTAKKQKRMENMMEAAKNMIGCNGILKMEEIISGKRIEDSEYQKILCKYSNDWVRLTENDGVFLETIDDYKGFSKQCVHAAARKVNSQKFLDGKMPSL